MSLEPVASHRDPKEQLAAAPGDEEERAGEDSLRLTPAQRTNAPNSSSTSTSLPLPVELVRKILATGDLVARDIAACARSSSALLPLAREWLYDTVFLGIERRSAEDSEGIDSAQYSAINAAGGIWSTLVASKELAGLVRKLVVQVGELDDLIVADEDKCPVKRTEIAFLSAFPPLIANMVNLAEISFHTDDHDENHIFQYSPHPSVTTLDIRVFDPSLPAFFPSLTKLSTRLELPPGSSLPNASPPPPCLEHLELSATFPQEPQLEHFLWLATGSADALAQLSIPYHYWSPRHPSRTAPLFRPNLQSFPSLRTLHVVVPRPRKVGPGARPDSFPLFPPSLVDLTLNTQASERNPYLYSSTAEVASLPSSLRRLALCGRAIELEALMQLLSRRAALPELELLDVRQCRRTWDAAEEAVEMSGRKEWRDGLRAVCAERDVRLDM